MSELYILYDKNGKFVGSTYDDGPPSNFESYAAGYRKLTYAEINLMNNEYQRYIYNEPTLRRVPEIHLGVSTTIFEIDGKTKLSVFVKALHNDTSEETQALSGEPIEVTVNGQKTTIPFGDMLLLNPDHPGTYVVTLSDPRFYAQTSKYIVSVIDKIQEA